MSGRRSVDEYLANIPSDMRAALRKLREAIRTAAPDAEEVISYRIPAFRQEGMLVYYAAFKDHCSFFPGSLLVQRKFAEELRPFRAGRGTFRFTPERPIPSALVRRIVKSRVAENESRAKAKRSRVRLKSKSAHSARLRIRS